MKVALDFELQASLNPAHNRCNSIMASLFCRPELLASEADRKRSGHSKDFRFVENQVWKHSFTVGLS
jgi:hypothetical protein